MSAAPCRCRHCREARLSLPPRAQHPALAAERVTVTLGNAEVLRGVDLELRAGTVCALLGPSGSGKTTLFRVLAGELAPASGRVRLGGDDVTAEPLWRRARRGIGWVPQGDSVLLDLTVAENLATFRSALGLPPTDPAPLAARLGLEGRLEVRASRLSGGERRRLGLLRALVAESSVLLLDEPLAGLDPTSIERVATVLVERRALGTAVLIADHRARAVLDLADDAHLLVEGRVEVSMPARDFAEHPAVRRRYLG